MPQQSVVLIDMPWSMLHRPSIQLGILRSVLQRANITTEVRSFNLAFMDHLTSAHADPSREHRFSFDDYLDVAENCWEEGLGDWIFAVAPFRDSGDWEERYLEYLRSTVIKEGVVAKAVQMRRLVPSFLERCAEEILRTAPKRRWLYDDIQPERALTGFGEAPQITRSIVANCLRRQQL